MTLLAGSKSKPAAIGTGVAVRLAERALGGEHRATPLSPVADHIPKGLGTQMPTHGLEHPAVLFCLGVIQVLGLISAFATRLARQSCSSKASQWVFFACLGMVAMSTLLT